VESTHNLLNIYLLPLPNTHSVSQSGHTTHEKIVSSQVQWSVKKLWWRPVR
jgi:hypothetical protein